MVLAIEHTMKGGGGGGGGGRGDIILAEQLHTRVAPWVYKWYKLAALET